MKRSPALPFILQELIQGIRHVERGILLKLTSRFRDTVLGGEDGDASIPHVAVRGLGGIERMEQNQGLFAKLMSDRDLADLVTGRLRQEVYDRIRDEGATATSGL